MTGMPDGYRIAVHSECADAGIGAATRAFARRPSAIFPDVGSIRRLGVRSLAQYPACAAIADGIGSRSPCRHVACRASCGVVPKVRLPPAGPRQEVATSASRER